MYYFQRETLLTLFWFLKTKNKITKIANRKHWKKWSVLLVEKQNQLFYKIFLTKIKLFSTELLDQACRVVEHVSETINGNLEFKKYHKTKSFYLKKLVEFFFFSTERLDQVCHVVELHVSETLKGNLEFEKFYRTKSFYFSTRRTYFFQNSLKFGKKTKFKKNRGSKILKK